MKKPTNPQVTTDELEEGEIPCNSPIQKVILHYINLYEELIQYHFIHQSMAISFYNNNDFLFFLFFPFVEP